MPANRRSRRARAARARRGRRGPAPPRGPLTRAGLALAGVVCMGVALVVLLSPHGLHTARGFAFLFLLGGALVVSACVA